MLLSAVVLLSCTKQKKPLPFYGTDDFDTDTVEATAAPEVGSTAPEEAFSADDEVAVPFVERGGVKLIDVTVNGQFTVKMILTAAVPAPSFLWRKPNICMRKAVSRRMTSSESHSRR